jgi:hypothetical protein
MAPQVAGAGRRWANESNSAQDGHTVSCHQAPSGGVIGACQVVEVLSVLVLAVPSHLLKLVPPHDLALVGDGLYVILIFVARLVECILLSKGTWCWGWLRPASPYNWEGTLW